MSVGKTHKMYLLGVSPEDAINNSEWYVYEDSAREDAAEGENVYSIGVTLFASRLKLVEKWA